MTEYWVSSAKYYCKICNCYMADNRMNRQHHESSARHKMNVDRVNKEKKNQKLNEARSEKELRETLQQIEKAARDAMVADGNEKYAAPPPRTSLPSQRQAFAGSNQRTPKPDQGEPQVQEEENSGFYTIRDKTYLDGKVFQEKLQDGRRCEIFVEELDDWYPAQITKRIQIKVPNTTIELLSFEVQYTISADDGTEEVAEETNVKTDRLRMIADEELDRDILDKIEEEKKLNEPPPPPAPIDENTGVSVWQTVSVTVYDEEEAYESHQKAVEDMYSNTKEIDEKVLASAGDKAEFGDVPFYQPKTYKGIVIEDTLVSTDAPVRDDEEDDGERIVAFKKRKLDETTSVKVEPTGDEAKPVFKPMAKKNFRKK